MSNLPITGTSTSPPLLTSSSGHLQMTTPPIITKFMVSINQSGQTILPLTSGNQQPSVSNIYVVGQASTARLQYVPMVGNLGGSLPSSISFAANFDAHHSTTMPHKMGSRMALSRPRLAIPAQQLAEHRPFITTMDQKNSALVSPVSPKNLQTISNLTLNVATSPSVLNLNPNLISSTSLVQKLLLPQSRTTNISRNQVPVSAMSINQQKCLPLNWSSTPSIIPINHLINKSLSGPLHLDQRPNVAMGNIRPENSTLLLVAPFQQQQKMLSPILPGPINLSAQSIKNSVQSQALNLTINRQQQAIILNSTPASLRASVPIPIPTSLVISKLGTGLNLARQKKNIRLSTATTTTMANQFSSTTSKQAHTVVSIQPVAPHQIVNQSQPSSNFTPIAKVTPQLQLFQQRQLQQQQQLQQQHFQNQQQVPNQLLQNNNQSIQLFQSQQQLQNQQILNQQQSFQLLQNQQQFQNQQQALQTFQGHQQHVQQKLQQHLLQQTKVSAVVSFNNAPIRLQNSQLFSVSQQGRMQPLCQMSEGVQLQAALLSPSVSLLSGLPFTLANDSNILQIDRSLALKGLGAEEVGSGRLMHISMEQLVSRSSHPISHSMGQVGTSQANLSQAIHVQNIKPRHQNLVSGAPSGICFTSSVVSSGKIQPFFTNMESPKSVVNFHVSAAATTESASQVLLSSPIFQQGNSDVIIKHQQHPPPQNSSPRPSILRKPVEIFVTPNVRKNLMPQLMSSQNIEIISQNDVPIIVTNTQVIPIEIRENSQSSTDTASSSEVAHKPSAKLNSHENAIIVTAANKPNNGGKLTPRKKPRKQSLHTCPDATTRAVGELIADEITMADDDEVATNEMDTIEAGNENEQYDVITNDDKSNIEISLNDSDISEYVDKNGLRWTLEKKRPIITMSQQYRCTWKPKYNHFNSIADVKPKEEKRLSLNEIANQKNIQERIGGSKLYLIAAQFDQLRDGEQEMVQRLRKFKDLILGNNENRFKFSEDELANLDELTMANIQRSQTCASQYDDVTDLLLKLVEGKSKVSEILNKHQSKRTSKKKDKNN